MEDNIVEIEDIYARPQRSYRYKPSCQIQKSLPDEAIDEPVEVDEMGRGGQGDTEVGGVRCLGRNGCTPKRFDDYRCS